MKVLKIINKKSKLQLPVPITAYSFVSRSGHLGLHNTSHMAKRNGLLRHSFTLTGVVLKLQRLGPDKEALFITCYF